MARVREEQSARSVIGLKVGGGTEVTARDGDKLEINPFASNRVIAGSSLTLYGRAKPPSVASIDEALARARYENGDNRGKMKRIAFFIREFHGGIAAGEQDTFSNNIYLREIRARCRQALSEFLETDIVNAHLVPSNEELLAMKYCAPQGELDATICGMLSDMGLLHLAQAHTNNIAPQGTAEKDKAGGDAGLNYQESEAHGHAEQSDDIARLKSELEVLKEQMDSLIAKDLVTRQDAAQLSQEIRTKTDEQRKTAEKMNADLAAEAVAGNRKQDEANALLRGDVATLDTKVKLLQEDLRTLSSKVEKPASSSQATAAQRQIRTKPAPMPLASPSGPPSRPGEKLTLSEIMHIRMQKRKQDALSQVESPLPKRASSASVRRENPPRSTRPKTLQDPAFLEF